MYDQVYPASITKIMTALLAMEYNQPDTQVTITEEDLALEDGSQMSGLAVGDTVTMDQLFHALLIYSANDAAMAIARQVGGSVENFVQMMNDLFKLHGQISDRREKRTGKCDGARRKNRNDR